MFFDKNLLCLWGQTREHLGESGTQKMELKCLKRLINPHFELIIDIDDLSGSMSKIVTREERYCIM